jgi:RNA polymerase sigma-70 factor (ECF subfamily)
MDRARELEIVGRLQRGDPEAFEAVFKAFNGRLYNFLARLSNRRDVAEDLLEETWVRLVVHARRLRPDTELGRWLFTVARHLHASHCRSRLMEDSHAAALIGLWPSGQRQPSPFEAIEANEAQEHMAKVLASLPLRYREALLLVVVEGLPHSEAAEICGVTTEAMRQRLSRARALLVRRMTEATVSGLESLKEIKA